MPNMVAITSDSSTPCTRLAGRRRDGGPAPPAPPRGLATDAALPRTSAPPAPAGDTCLTPKPAPPPPVAGDLGARRPSTSGPARWPAVSTCPKVRCEPLEKLAVADSFERESGSFLSPPAPPPAPAPPAPPPISRLLSMRSSTADMIADRGSRPTAARPVSAPSMLSLPLARTDSAKSSRSTESCTPRPSSRSWSERSASRLLLLVSLPLDAALEAMSDRGVSLAVGRSPIWTATEPGAPPPARRSALASSSPETSEAAGAPGRTD
mmetsp:Transcript_11179/g.30645  ORF Transcript_11179/g.30645 Transcript_11179/m.30645 type:complete len:266 (-) Transcript_11179:463-1260(-)